MFSRTRPRHDNPSKTLRKPSITTPKNLPSTPILRPDLNSYLTTISFRLLNLRTDPPSRSYGRAPRKSPNSCFQEKTPPVPKPPRPNSDTIVCTANIHAPGKLMTFVTSAPKNVSLATAQNCAAVASISVLPKASRKPPPSASSAKPPIPRTVPSSKLSATKIASRCRLRANCPPRPFPPSANGSPPVPLHPPLRRLPAIR